MARVQYGVIVTSLKGNVGGQTFQNGNTVNVLRNKGYRAGTSSQARVNANHNLTAQTTRWRTLTNMQREAWASGASDWAFTDKFGNTYYGSGYQYFVAYNSALTSIGESAVDTPGTPGTFTNVVETTPGFDLGSGIALDISTLTPNVQIAQVFASKPMSPGRNGNNVSYRSIGQFDTSVDDEFSDTTVYYSLFGIPPVGSKVCFKLVVRAVDFPRANQVIYSSCIVTS